MSQDSAGSRLGFLCVTLGIRSAISFHPLSPIRNASCIVSLYTDCTVSTCIRVESTSSLRATAIPSNILAPYTGTIPQHTHSHTRTHTHTRTLLPVRHHNLQLDKGVNSHASRVSPFRPHTGTGTRPWIRSRRPLGHKRIAQRHKLIGICICMTSARC